MAKKKEENNELFEASPDELDAVLAGLPSSDTIINLWRQQAQGPPSYVAEFSPSDFSLEGVKNTYGGGKYKIVAKGNGEVRTSVFTVDGEPKTSASKPVYKRYINGKLVFSKQEDADVVFSDNVRGLNVGTGNGEGNNNVMLLLLTEIRAMRESFQQKPQSSDDVKKGFLEEMLVFKQLFGAQQNPVQDFSKVAIDLIKQGMEVASMAENGGSPWMMIIDKVMPTIQEALKVVAMQSKPIDGRIALNHNQNLNVELPAKPIVQLTGFDAIAGELQAYLPTFIRAASIGTDPMILVDMTIPNIQDAETANKVILWLESGEWLQDLSKLHPAIVAQAAWWSDFRMGLLEALKNPQNTIDSTIEESES